MEVTNCKIPHKITRFRYSSKEVAPAESWLVATRFATDYIFVRARVGDTWELVRRFKHIPLEENNVRFVQALEVRFGLDATDARFWDRHPARKRPLVMDVRY